MLRINQDDDCPTQDFEEGEPNGKCWGDGHYKCDDCIFFRADFKADINKRDALLRGQGAIQFLTWSENLNKFQQVV